MKDEYKKKIWALRLKGKGYKSIASALELKLDTVMKYCKYHGLGGPAEYVKHNYQIWCVKNHRCPVCGGKLIQHKRGRKKKFCSGKCRSKYCRNKEDYEVVSVEVPDESILSGNFAVTKE